MFKIEIKPFWKSLSAKVNTIDLCNLKKAKPKKSVLPLPDKTRLGVEKYKIDTLSNNKLLQRLF